MTTPASKLLPLPPDRPQPPSYGLPGIYSFDFTSVHTEKPWRKPGVDISDYFNYGFNEELWRAYVEKIRELHEHVKYPKNKHEGAGLPYKGLPAELGGTGAPLNSEFRDYESLRLLLDRPEQFLALQNLAENNFYMQQSSFMESALLSENGGYYAGILMQFAEKHGVDPQQKLKKLSNSTYIKPAVIEFTRKREQLNTEKQHPPSPKRAIATSDTSYIDFDKLKLRRDTEKPQMVRLKKRSKPEETKLPDEAHNIKKTKDV